MANDHLKEWNKIIAAGDAAKHREQNASAERIAALEVKDVEKQHILEEVVKRITDLEQLQPKPKRAKVRVGKAPKKKG